MKERAETMEVAKMHLSKQAEISFWHQKVREWIRCLVQVEDLRVECEGVKAKMQALDEDSYKAPVLIKMQALDEDRCFVA